MSHMLWDNSTIKMKGNEMSWTKTLLYKLSAFCRCRVINGPDHQPYLERYHLLRLPFGYRIYLHRFVASDPGRGLHNHPWKHALSLVLCGSYEETRMLDARADNTLHSRRLRAGDFNFISGDVFHRVNITSNITTTMTWSHRPATRSGGNRPGARSTARRCACPAQFKERRFPGPNLQR
jgi:hypothetical protein